MARALCNGLADGFFHCRARAVGEEPRGPGAVDTVWDAPVPGGEVQHVRLEEALVPLDVGRVEQAQCLLHDEVR